MATLDLAEPTADQQVRVVVLGSPATGSFRFTKGGQRYTLRNISDWRAWVRLQIAEAVQEMIPKGYPVEVVIIIRRAKPTSFPKNPTAKCPCPWAWTSKPDCDNVTKPIKDSLKSIAFADDNQVTDLHVYKRQGEGWQDEVEIRVRRLSEEEMGVPE